MTKHNKPDSPSDEATVSMQAKVSVRQARQVKLALDAYGVSSVSDFFKKCMAAIVDAHDRGESVPLPLRFWTIPDYREEDKNK
jgi:hypothetical protein